MNSDYTLEKVMAMTETYDAEHNRHCDNCKAFDGSEIAMMGSATIRPGYSYRWVCPECGFNLYEKEI